MARLWLSSTIIEPFVGEKKDFASFTGADVLSIEKDKSLLIPGRWIQVFVPVGTLWNQPRPTRDSIVQSVHAWIKSNRLALAEGTSQHPCRITGVPGRPAFDIALTSGWCRWGVAAPPGKASCMCAGSRLITWAK